MKITTGIIATALVFGAGAALAGPYDVSDVHPYGLPNPDAPEQLADFAFAIGKWSCDASTPRADGEWQTVKMDWEFHYILNGRAIQDYFEDEFIRGMGIRQFNQAEGKWHVAYHAEWPGHSNSMWVGAKSGDDIVLDRTVTRQDGTEMIMRLSFIDIGTDDGGEGFSWKGEFVTSEGSNDFWRISCNRPVE